MEEKSSGIEIRKMDLWLIFKRCWWVMLAVLLLAAVGLSAFTVATHKNEYTATAVVWALGSNAASTASTSTSDVSIGTQLINDYKQLLVSDTFLQDVVKETHPSIGANKLSSEVQKLRSMIKVEHEEGTRVMYVLVTSNNREESKVMADTLVDMFSARVNSYGDAEKKQELITVFGETVSPETPSNPISFFRIAIIAVVCAILVYVVYLIIFLLDDKISTAEDVQKHLGVSTLGIIPNRQDAIRRKNRYDYYGVPLGQAKRNSEGEGKNT